MASIVGKRVALMGGAGFIGHNLALQLVRAGAHVFVVDSLQVNNLLSFVSGPGAEAIPSRDLYINIINERLELLRQAMIPLHVQDVRDYHATSRILTEIKPDVIVHLAAVAHANKSNKDPFSTFDHSLRTLENTLDWARHAGVHFVYFSSSMVYGNFKDGYVTEESVCEPLGIYGALKYAGEKMVISYNQVFKLPYTIVRPSALYGERCVSRRVGQVFIENALEGLEVAVAGDGSDRLDFTYIGDLCNGIQLVLENPAALGQTFNLTYGESRSIAEMAQLIKDHFPEVSVKYLAKDELMPSRGTLSVEKARKLLGYNPQFPLERGFVDYINWYKGRSASKANFQMVTLNVQ